LQPDVLHVHQRCVRRPCPLPGWHGSARRRFVDRLRPAGSSASRWSGRSWQACEYARAGEVAYLLGWLRARAVA
ncbi:MAG: hypothetical protein ACK56I_35270, partial [bacterium]